MPSFTPTITPGLRSPADKVGGLVYFGRMIDKRRLAAEGKLPPEWEAKRGDGMKGTFDARCCHFLRVRYADLEREVLTGGRSDEELLEWAFTHGRRPDEQDIEIWNGFMAKRGWRDAGTPFLLQRLADLGLAAGSVETMFEIIDIDEGRVAHPGL